jgi:hypothetical protein
MKRILLLTGLTTLSAVAADVGGTWAVTGTLGNTPLNLSCTLLHVGTQLKGSCSGTGLNVQLTDAASEGQAVTFRYSVQSGGKTVPVVFTGAVTSPTTMKGTISGQSLGTGTFQGAKK